MGGGEQNNNNINTTHALATFVLSAMSMNEQTTNSVQPKTTALFKNATNYIKLQKSSNQNQLWQRKQEKKMEK
jgi:hypothetical protein